MPPEAPPAPPAKLPVTFDPPEDLPVELKTAVKAPVKTKKAVNQALTFARFGVQVLRVKARALAALGKEAENSGIKQIGHGKILVASDNAETAIARLGIIVDKMLKDKSNVDYETILEIMRLQKEFNSQLIKAAEAHFNADKLPAPPGMPNGGITMPFPAGAPVMIGVGKVSSESGSKT